MAGTVFNDPDAMAELGNAVRGLALNLDRLRGNLLHTLTELRATWRDSGGAQYETKLMGCLDEYYRATRELEAAARPLDSLRERLNHYLSATLASPSGLETTASSAVRGAPATLIGVPSRGVVGRIVPVTGGTTARTLVPAAWLRNARIEWALENNDMKTAFHSTTHHGYDAKDYLKLASALPAVLAALEAPESSMDVFFERESGEYRAYRAFFGSDPIRIERTSDNLLNVIDGRHRLFACMELGVDAPVELVEAFLDRDGDTP